MTIQRWQRRSRLPVLLSAVVLGMSGFAIAGNPAFKVFGDVTSVEQIEKKDQSTFYEIEKKKFDRIQSYAKEAYLDAYWKKLAREKKSTPEMVSKEYFISKVKLTDAEVQATLQKLANHPQLSKLPKKEQESQVRNYLRERDTQQVIEALVDEAVKKGDLKVLYPEPSEPIYDVPVVATDHVRYGPHPAGTAPNGCEGDKCPITVIEYSEYQCPFCERVIPETTRILEEYKGKIRWIVRDYPLPFHDRARPAAIAAKCASFQGKYWDMYSALFSNQTKLGDQDLEKYASDIGLDKKKYDACVKNPQRALKIIDDNTASGQKYGVNGTPAFFINGIRKSGAIPYEEFKRTIDEELKKKKITM